jgi:hypothetical protein
MAAMTVPQKINDFLLQRQERMYCDTCIQERLGLKWRQQVQLITATLAVTAGFRREFNKCCTCEEIKQVTHAIGDQPRPAPVPSTAAAPKLRVNVSPRPQPLDTEGVDTDGLGASPLDAHLVAGPAQRTDYPAAASRSVSAHGGESN